MNGRAANATETDERIPILARESAQGRPNNNLCTIGITPGRSAPGDRKELPLHAQTFSLKQALLALSVRRALGPASDTLPVETRAHDYGSGDESDALLLGTVSGPPPEDMEPAGDRSEPFSEEEYDYRSHAENNKLYELLRTSEQHADPAFAPAAAFRSYVDGPSDDRVLVRFASPVDIAYACTLDLQDTFADTIRQAKGVTGSAPSTGARVFLKDVENGLDAAPHSVNTGSRFYLTRTTDDTIAKWPPAFARKMEEHINEGHLPLRACTSEDGRSVFVYPRPHWVPSGARAVHSFGYGNTVPLFAPLRTKPALVFPEDRATIRDTGSPSHSSRIVGYVWEERPDSWIYATPFANCHYGADDRGGFATEAEAERALHVNAQRASYAYGPELWGRLRHIIESGAVTEEPINTQAQRIDDTLLSMGLLYLRRDEQSPSRPGSLFASLIGVVAMQGFG